MLVMTLVMCSWSVSITVCIQDYHSEFCRQAACIRWQKFCFMTDTCNDTLRLRDPVRDIQVHMHMDNSLWTLN